MKAQFSIISIGCLFLSVMVYPGIGDWFGGKGKSKPKIVAQAPSKAIKCVSPRACRNSANDGKCCDPNVGGIPMPPQPMGICKNGGCAIE